MQAKESLRGAARRRSELEVAMQQVERTAAAPASGPAWVDNLTKSVRQLERAINQHAVEVEAPSGLLEQIVDTAPRLQRIVEVTREHHVQLAQAATTLLNELANAREAKPIPVAEIRTGVLDLLGELARHRQKGADLIYEAYDVDIGGY